MYRKKIKMCNKNKVFCVPRTVHCLPLGANLFLYFLFISSYYLLYNLFTYRHTYFRDIIFYNSNNNNNHKLIKLFIVSARLSSMGMFMCVHKTFLQIISLLIRNIKCYMPNNIICNSATTHYCVILLLILYFFSPFVRSSIFPTSSGIDEEHEYGVGADFKINAQVIVWISDDM